MNDLNRKNILVVGDVMLDVYYQGSIKRISPEAPVPVFKKNNEYSRLGGAANVAANLSAANQNVFLASVVGNDEYGTQIVNLLEEHGINSSLIIKDDTRPTISKTRFLASNNQQVLRLDIEETKDISNEISDYFISKIETIIDSIDIVLLSDYLKGVLTPLFTKRLIELSNKHGKRVLVDVKDPNYKKYDGAYLLKPNKNELAALTGMPVDNDSEIESAARYLLKDSGANYILVTRGSKGMDLYDSKKRFHVDALNREVFDVTGAGDTSIAYLCNLAAAIQVGKVCSSAVTMSELESLSNTKKQNNKIVELDELCNILAGTNKKIVFTNGCFDILHVGHVQYLREAAQLGDILVIGLNSDASIKRIKGEDRPINKEQDRAEILAALEFVDYVVLFEEDTPINLIKAIKPNVLVKGGDYKKENIVGWDFVEQNGGEVKTISFVEGKSTTNIINLIKKK